MCTLYLIFSLKKTVGYVATSATEQSIGGGNTGGGGTNYVYDGTQ